MKQFTTTQEWIEINGNTAYVGLAKQACGQIGPVEFIGLPPYGEVLRADEEGAIVESRKAAISITCPKSGRVIAVNEKLEENPELLQQDPEGEGWLFQLELLSDEDTPSV
jgi:glycine cleavage system H protein